MSDFRTTRDKISDYRTDLERIRRKHLLGLSAQDCWDADRFTDRIEADVKKIMIEVEKNELSDQERKSRACAFCSLDKKKPVKDTPFCAFLCRMLRSQMDKTHDGAKPCFARIALLIASLWDSAGFWGDKRDTLANGGHNETPSIKSNDNY